MLKMLAITNAGRVDSNSSADLMGVTLEKQ